MAHSILLVDDEANIALSLEFMMKRNGYEVRTVSSGDAALEAMRQRRPDLVLLDVMMPGRSGYEVCQAVRADPTLSDVKIVILTAKGGPLEGERALALGADAYVSKPFSMEDLSRRVRELLAPAPRQAG